MSLTLRSVVRSYELVVGGELNPAFVDALGGFEIVRSDHGCTHLAGRVEGQGHLYDVLAVVGASDVDLVSLRPITDGLE